MNSYPFGTLVLLSSAFTDADDVPVDPTLVTLYVRGSDGVKITYPSDALTKVSTGVYTRQVIPEFAGVWRYRFEGTGAAIAAGENKFEVKPSDFGGETEST